MERAVDGKDVKLLYSPDSIEEALLTPFFIAVDLRNSPPNRLLQAFIFS